MLSSIELLPRNEEREDEPDRCASCSEEMDGSTPIDYCPNHCAISVDIDAMLSEIEQKVLLKIEDMRVTNDAAYRLSLWRQVRSAHQEVMKLWKEICK